MEEEGQFSFSCESCSWHLPFQAPSPEALRDRLLDLEQQREDVFLALKKVEVEEDRALRYSYGLAREGKEERQELLSNLTMPEDQLLPERVLLRTKTSKRSRKVCL